MVKELFPTLIYESKINSNILKNQLLKEILIYQKEDKRGIEWSKKNYLGGYTSYNSLSKLHEISPTFDDLRKKIDSHVLKYIKKLNYDLSGRSLEMTTLWANVMPTHTYHPLHTHPLSVISGTFYVQTPNDCSALKIEDTKMSLLMSAPPRKSNDYYYHFKPKPCSLILFESWVRHEVPPNTSKKPRISVSFNYEWI